MVLLLLVGLTFSASSKMRKQLQAAENITAIRAVYERMKKKIKAKTIAGYILFGVLSNFFLLYIICFAHVAN